jgi:peptidoglycan/xylan/chitin deacetylase (PgdA/CDA1 family)
MTTYLAAYDVEAADCLDALRAILPLHERFDIPATLFLVARRVDDQADEYRELLAGHRRVEIASHSYTHMLLRDHPVCGPAGPRDQRPREIVDSKRRLEDVFGCDVRGFRAPVSFEDGLAGDSELLALCDRAGYRYVSTLAWAPGTTLPALVREPFAYAEQGFPDLWEVPPCGWHDNVLKEHNSPHNPLDWQISPHPYPEIQIDGYVETPEDEAALNRKLIDRAVRIDALHISLIWHPWSLHRFDPEMRMLERTFEHVKALGLPVSTFADYVKTL